MKKSIENSTIDIEKNKIDYGCLHVVVNTDLIVDGWADAEDDQFINKYSVNIELEEFDEIDEDTDSKRTTIGNALCCYIDEFSYTKDRYVDMRDIADAADGDIYLAVSSVTDKEGQLLEDYFAGGILYIDKFYIIPAYREKGIGKAIFPLILDVLGRGAGAITIIPSPTEEDGNTRMKEDDPRYEPTLKRMTNFIKQFGFFKPNNKKNVWVKNNSMV